MNEAIYIAVIGLLAAPVAALVTWLANRRKNIGDIYSSLTDSASASVDMMQSTMETLHDELKSANEKIEKLIAANLTMQEEIAKLRQQNLLLLEENHTLSSKIDDLVRLMNNSDHLTPSDPVS